MYRQLIRQKRYALMYVILIFCLYNLFIQKIYGFSIFPDEFSYWSYSGKILGYDWSNIMSLSSFYACGYSIFLIPILKFVNNTVIAYRIAISLNFIFVVVSYALLNMILKEMRVDSVGRDNRHLLLAGAMMYPPILFYAQTTLVESVLLVGYVLSIYFLMKYLKTKKNIYILFQILCCDYLYLTHKRTVCIVVGCLLILIVYQFAYEKSRIRGFFTLALMLTSIWVMSLIQSTCVLHTYQCIDANLFQANTMKGQFEKLAILGSLEGVIELFRGILGKILYLGMASFGIGFLGLFEIYKRIRSRNIDLEEKAVLLYIIITLFIQIGISVIYNLDVTSYDSIFFGRYHDYMMPIVLFFGYKRLIDCNKSLKKEFAYLLLIQLLLLFITCFRIKNEYVLGFKGYFVPGIAFFDNLSNEPYKYMFFSFFVCTVIMLMLFFIVTIYKKNGYSFVLTTYIAIPMAVLLILSKEYIYKYNALAYQDIKISEKIEELINTKSTLTNIYYIDYNDISAIGLIQFCLKDTIVDTLPECESIESYMELGVNEDCIILLGANDPSQKMLEDYFDEEIIKGHFVLLYNTK